MNRRAQREVQGASTIQSNGDSRRLGRAQTLKTSKRRSVEAADQRRVNLQRRLEDELERLRSKAGVGHNLKVVWSPYGDEKLSGRVDGSTLFVYECDEDLALEALRHEFVDYLVSQAVEPYRSVANRLINLLNEVCYRRKEEVVEALLKLL